MSLENVAKLLDRRATFTINKNQVYKAGEIVPNRVKFVETIAIAAKSEDILNTVVARFPAKILKLKSGLHKVIYSGKGAVAVINAIYPYLEIKKKAADIILELFNHKNASRAHAPELRMRERDEIRERILQFNAL